MIKPRRDFIHQSGEYTFGDILKYMKIIAVNPIDRFSGIDEMGWLLYPNSYNCRFCNYGVSFSQAILTKEENTNGSDGPKLPKLKGRIKVVFEEEVRKSIDLQSSNFAIGFHCPKCESPVAITFVGKEFSMLHYRFKPIVIYEAEETPNSKEHNTAR